MSRKPHKSSGKIGATKISSSPRGTVAEYIHTELPEDKEGLESFFAKPFVDAFNDSQPLGDGVKIEDIQQNDTSDLDFDIDCEAAKFLELAELNPRSETFGRLAYKTGKLNVFEYSRWIYRQLIDKKQKAYGNVAGDTILLLYCTHWQFQPARQVIECLRSWCIETDASFAAICFLATDGKTLKVIDLIHPYAGKEPPASRSFKKLNYENGEPGKSEWTVG